jgi:hypothetical protein
MQPQDVHRLHRRRDALLAKLRGLPNLMRGTLYQAQRKCGRASCRCATGGPRHLTLRLNVTLSGRTHTRFVRKAQRAEVEAMLVAYRRLWELVNELTEVNLALLHAEPPEGLSR